MVEKHGSNAKLFQLPYRGNISMLIALPRKLTGMRTLEQQISPTVVNKWLRNMTNRSAGSAGIGEKLADQMPILTPDTNLSPQDSRGGAASVQAGAELRLD